MAWGPKLYVHTGWDAPLALAPGAPRRRPLAAPAPSAVRRHAAALLRPPGRGVAEPPPLPLPADHVAALDARHARADRARAALAGATRLGPDRAAAVKSCVEINQ